MQIMTLNTENVGLSYDTSETQLSRKWWTASTLVGKKILNDRVNLPTPNIRLFGKDGSYNGRHYFEPQFRCAEQGEDTMTEEESSMDTSESENGHTEDMIEQEQNPHKNEQTQSEHTN